MDIARLLTISLLHFGFVKANDHCRKGKCQTYSLDIYGDAMENSELVSHVFHKSAIINLIQCFTWCVDDCRCLSFNYKENKEGKVYELNEGSHFTNQSSLIHSLGSRYYILNRKFSQQVLLDYSYWNKLLIACAFLTQINHVTNTVMWAKAWNAGKMYFVGVIKFSCKKPTHFPGIVDLILRKVLSTNIEILSLNKVVLLYEPKSCLVCFVFVLCTLDVSFWGSNVY